jgi:hypothetical protein
MRCPACGRRELRTRGQADPWRRPEGEESPAVAASPGKRRHHKRGNRRARRRLIRRVLAVATAIALASAVGYLVASR